MAPKKEKKKEDDTNKAAFTEVEKEFMVLQIADLNRKVTRLRSALEEYENRNEELQRAYDQLDEDRADIIAYLKKSLIAKTEENNELKEKVRGLEETRQIENAKFEQKVNELEKNFDIMKDHLSAENKLLSGKLNTLEEFRAARDDLMRKFEKQEEEFKEQEEKYKKIIYEAEKKFTTDKVKLKKEMESRLLQLAQDFQDATELRIAASTHRVIRENIAINNELDSMLLTQTKLSKQNEKYKESEKEAKLALKLAEEERDKMISKNVIQLKVIEKLTTALQEVKKKSSLYDEAMFDFDSLNQKIQNLTTQNESLTLQINTLKDNIKTMSENQNKLLTQSSKVVEENTKVKNILNDAAVVIRKALKIDPPQDSDPTVEVIEKQALLSSLLEIITQHREILIAESPKMAALDTVYQEGDLGFIPKPQKKKSTSATSIVYKESLKLKSRPTSMSSLKRASTKVTLGKERAAVEKLPPILQRAKSIDSSLKKEAKHEHPGVEVLSSIDSQIIKSGTVSKTTLKPKTVKIVESLKDKDVKDIEEESEYSLRRESELELYKKEKDSQSIDLEKRTYKSIKESLDKQDAPSEEKIHISTEAVESKSTDGEDDKTV